MTKVTAYITLTKEFESENPEVAEFFAKDFVQIMHDSVPYESLNASFRTVTGGEADAKE